MGQSEMQIYSQGSLRAYAGQLEIGRKPLDEFLYLSTTLGTMSYIHHILCMIKAEI